MSFRCFIAIEIEDKTTLTEIIKIKEELVMKGLDIKPVEDENIHLTLRFLGEISQNTVNAIKDMLVNISRTINKFEIVVRGLGAFPSITNPRVIWVGINRGSEYLYQVRKIIDYEISEKKIDSIHRDNHEFHPHITIARVKSSKNINYLYEIYNNYHDYLFGTTPITKIKLKQSILRPQGPLYRDIFIVELR